MLETWRIGRSKGACSRCGQKIPPQRPFFSCLYEEGDELVRRDFCVDCWEPAEAAPFLCFWRTRRPPAEPRQTVDTGLMLQLFERLHPTDTERKRVVRFVLALYLMRRKELKLLEVRRQGGQEQRVLEQRGAGGRAMVENPRLTEEQIQDTAGRLSQLLNADL